MSISVITKDENTATILSTEELDLLDRYKRDLVYEAQITFTWRFLIDMEKETYTLYLRMDRDKLSLSRAISHLEWKQSNLPFRYIIAENIHIMLQEINPL